MLKMVIVDNEEKNLKQTEKVVKEYFKEIEIIGRANTGLEALNLMKKKQPDILIINVSLSEISGLDVVRKIRFTNYHMKIIMQSTYEYFELIQEAIELEVGAYLLKPVTANKLVTALGRVVTQLREKEAYTEELRRKKIYIHNIKEIIENGFVYTVLFNSTHKEGLERYYKVIDFPKVGYAMNIEIETRNPDKIAILRNNDSALYHKIKNILKPYGKSVVGPRIAKRIIILLGDTICSPNIIAKDIISELGYLLQTGLYVGIGSQVKIENIHDSYEESIRSLRFTKEKIIEVEKVQDSYIKYQNYYLFEEKFLDSVRFGKEESLEIFSKILECFQELKPEEKRNKIIEILILSTYNARLEGTNETEYTNYMEYYRQLMLMPIEKIEEWAYIKMEHILKAVRTSRSGRKSGTIQEAIQYMIERWSQKSLSLEEVAQYVGISPQHFSKIFKEQTGSKYIDFLTKLKINEAKKYLMEGNKTIKEVGYLVGYEDPNYFSRVFKRVEGISPSEYVQSECSEKSN